MPRSLRNALRAKYRSPREAIKALGLDESVIDVKQLAFDESERTKEEHEGKLGERTREEIGRVGGAKREEQPDSDFLEPASKKYPVKKDGKYDRGLLLAAAREARMHGHEELAQRADAIRKREFGSAESKGNDAMPNRLQYLLVTRAARIFNPQLATDAKDVDYAKLFAGVTPANLKSRRPAIVADAKKMLKGKTVTKDATVEHLAHLLDQLEHVKNPESLDESVSEPQHKAMEAAAHGHSNIGIPEEVGKEFADKDKGKGFDSEGFMAKLKEHGMSDDAIKDCMDMLPDEMPDNALDESEEEREKREREEKEKKEKEAADKAAKDEAEAKEREAAKDKSAMDARLKNIVTTDDMNKAIKAAVDTANKNALGAVQARDFVRPYVGEVPIALDSAEKIHRSAAKILGIDDAETVHASALPTLIKAVGRTRTQDNTNAYDHVLAVESATDPFELFPEARRIGSV